MPFLTFNLPLQVWPIHQDPDNDQSAVIGTQLINYMPRRARCETLNLEDALEGMSREEFFNKSAEILENLAKLMRRAGKNEKLTVYYPDEGMVKGDAQNGKVSG